MKFKALTAAALAFALSCVSIERAAAQATILPTGETCFQATTGVNGMVGVLGTITGGASYTAGTYGGVSLTGGSGSGATANISVSGGSVTGVTILNPGSRYVVGDVLSVPAASIGGTGAGFSVPVASTSINSSLAGGTVAFYVPNTNTIKQTWQDSGQTILNQNPVPLDANGCALIYGVGTYRQVVQDSIGDTVWDQLTASTSPVGIFWAGQALGTPNAITITDSSFANGAGTSIQFLALRSNTGPTTITVSGGLPISVVKDTATGPIPLSGGEIGPANTPLVTYDQINAVFHLVNPASAASGGSSGAASVVPPQGYLNLVGQASGDPVQKVDVVAVSTIFYSPLVGNLIPIWNGSSFTLVVFSELTTTLTAAGSPSGVIQDECVFSNNGVPTLVTGPAWTTATVGAGSRGTGAGSAQISRLNGIWVNANSMVGYNGSATYTIPANQCTYVGSVWIDTAAGQTSAYITAGQTRKWGIWNAYNRQRIVLQVTDPAASWTDGINGFHSTHSLAANALTVLTGLPEETVISGYEQNVTLTNAGAGTQQAAIAIGINSSSGSSGQISSAVFTTSAGNPTWQGTLTANFVNAPSLGLNSFFALSNAGTSTVAPTYLGGTNMLLSAHYSG